jgi:hypothetical protein
VTIGRAYFADNGNEALLRYLMIDSLCAWLGDSDLLCDWSVLDNPVNFGRTSDELAADTENDYWYLKAHI